MKLNQQSEIPDEDENNQEENKRDKMPTRSRARGVKETGQKSTAVKKNNKKSASKDQESSSIVADVIPKKPNETPPQPSAAKYKIVAGSIKSDKFAKHPNPSEDVLEHQDDLNQTNNKSRSANKTHKRSTSIKMRKLAESIPVVESNFVVETNPVVEAVEEEVKVENVSHQDQEKTQNSAERESNIPKRSSQHETPIKQIEQATNEKKQATSRKRSRTAKKNEIAEQTPEPIDEAMQADTLPQQKESIMPTIMEEVVNEFKHTDHYEIMEVTQQVEQVVVAVEDNIVKQPKNVKSKSNKSESIPPVVVEAPQLPPINIKLTEDEIKAKYADNEEYQEWSRRIQRFRQDFERGMKKGLPKIYFFDEELQAIANDHQRIQANRLLISERYQEFKVQNIEPSGEDESNFDFGSFFEDQEVRRAFFKLIAFKVEGSSMTLKELRSLCFKIIIQEHFPDLSISMTDMDVDLLITSFALRKSYGLKPKNPIVYQDSTPLSLWCWEVQESSLLEPVSDNQIKKARTQRMIVGKKLITLNQVIELCSDNLTFDSTEKISKLNQEFENFNKLTTKESQSEWIIRKRKHNEVDPSDSLKVEAKASAGSVANSKSQKPNLNGKRIKPNNEETSEWMVNEVSEPLIINEKSEASAILATPTAKKPQGKDAPTTPAQVQVTKLESFFQKAVKPADNPSTFLIKTREEMSKNPHISYGGQCETEAMKVRASIISAEWPTFDSSSILNKFKELKARETDNAKATQAKQIPSFLKPSQNRLKHIFIHDSGMSYIGNYFEKHSRIISCKKPFQKDPSVVDYDLDSEEEWEELYGENLEDDDNLIEEENMEVEEDEAEMLNLPRTGVSTSIKEKLAFRSQYCFNTLQYKEDDPELRKEGFIVADDYFSQDSSIIDGEENDHSGFEFSRKELLLKQLERTEQRMRQNVPVRPYILMSAQVDLGDYKAVSLKKKLKKQPPMSTSRISFGGNATTADESQIEHFPLSVASQKVVITKQEIKDVIEQLIELAHGSTLPKKQLIENVRKEYLDLKKTHIELFFKECFEKQKRPHDSKTRLYAKTDAIEKYGCSADLFSNIPLILEKKIEEEKALALQAAVEANNQPPTVSQIKQPFDLATGPIADLMPSPMIPSKQSTRQRQSRAAGAASRQSSASQQIAVNHEPTALSHQSKQGKLSMSQFNESLVAQSSLKAQQSLDQESNVNDGEAIQVIIEQPIASTHDETVVGHVEDVEMANEQQPNNAFEENSWVNVQAGASGSGNNVETPAFNTKQYSLAGGDLENEDMQDNDQVNQFLHQESNQSANQLAHSQSYSFLDDQQISLSQHAIVQYKETEDQQEVEIAQGTFTRALQQNHSTPIHNFRTLRSRDISVKNSQNCIEEGLGYEQLEQRPRSDSMETDKGNPMQDRMMSHLEEHLALENGVGTTTYVNMQHSFESPDNGNRKHNQELIPSHYLEGAPESLFEESKLEVQDAVQPLIPSSEDLRDLIDPHGEITTSKKHFSRRPSAIASIRKSSTHRRESGVSQDPPRRSKRLESKHQMISNLQETFHQDDELNQAYSQEGQQK